MLIVDDNEINRMIASKTLAPLKVRIETASDGKEALDMVKQKDCDLFFMDHLMPVMDGLEAVKAIRLLPGERYRTLPVIALTAREQQEEYLRAGMSDFLPKPIDMTESRKKIRQWIPEKLKPASGN